MCIQVIERYALCRCLYYKHQIDFCSNYRRRGHCVQCREILVGYACLKHSGLKHSDDKPDEQSLARDGNSTSSSATGAYNTSLTPQPSVHPSSRSNMPHTTSACPDEDAMQTIRSRLLMALNHDSAIVELSICIPCNIGVFMDQQFAGSNSDLGRVVTLSGLAVCGQATTCSNYIRSHWPLQGLWALSILQDAFDNKEEKAEGKKTSDYCSML